MRLATNKNIRFMTMLFIVMLACFSYCLLPSQADHNAREERQESKIDKILSIANDSSDDKQQINVYVLPQNASASALVNNSVGKISSLEAGPIVIDPN